jgi:hypothetical protein
MLRPLAGRLAAGLLALAAFSLAFAGPAAADARSDLRAAFKNNLAAKSYRATITDLATGKQVSSVEFQAPDRFRITPVGAPASVIADGKMHMQANGRAMSMPLPAGMLENLRSDSAWKQMDKDTLIRDAGLGAVAGEPARKYHWISSGKNASTGDAWVSLKSGRVIQVETAAQPGSKAGAVRVRYTDFDSAAIRINAPKP